MIRRAVAVLFSETTRAALAAEARRSGALYRCRAAGGAIDWVVGPRAYLAPYGALAALRRLGVPAALVGEHDVRSGSLDAYPGLVVADAAGLPSDVAATVVTWLRDARHSLVASGVCAGLDDALGLRRHGRLLADAVVLAQDGREQVPLVGPGSTLDEVTPRDDAIAVGRLSLSHPECGETALALPAAIATGRTLFLAVPIFEHLAGALQAHVDVEALRDPWARRGAAGLEEAVGWLHRLLAALPAIPWRLRIPPWGRHPSAVVLRHDTDHSRDTSYLEAEVAERIPATYAVLPDANRRHWLEQLRPHRHLEAAFHYRTNVEGRLAKLVRRAKGYVPDPRAVTGRGLIRQARAARRRGIPIGTLHRHASFFFYPESVAGLDALARGIDDVVGTASMFRWTVYRYGDAPFSHAVTVLHPDTSVPFWMPFQPVVSAHDGHTIVRAWESTHLIEPDPALLARVFSHADASPGGAYMLGYHPAHARAATFTPGGNFAWFASAVAEARARGWWIATCRDLYERLAGWEQLDIAVDADGVRIRNASARMFPGLVVVTPKGPIEAGDLPPGAGHAIAW